MANDTLEICKSTRFDQDHLHSNGGSQHYSCLQLYLQLLFRCIKLHRWLPHSIRRYSRKYVRQKPEMVDVSKCHSHNSLYLGILFTNHFTVTVTQLLTKRKMSMPFTARRMQS